METPRTTEYRPAEIAYLVRLFEAHGLPSVMGGDNWFLPLGVLPAVRAAWRPGEPAGVLTVQVLLEGGVLIKESCGGFGKGMAGLNDALANFTISVFHVLLAALWNHPEDPGVTVKEWLRAGQSHTGYFGQFGTRNLGQESPALPPGLFPAIQETIRAEALTEGVHWFRLFFAQGGNATPWFEALKDNEEWEAGLSCIRAQGCGESGGCYSSVRMFAMVRVSAPATQPEIPAVRACGDGVLRGAMAWLADLWRKARCRMKG